VVERQADPQDGYAVGDIDGPVISPAGPLLDRVYAGRRFKRNSHHGRIAETPAEDAAWS
jgi:hypothetical protein